MSLRGMSRNALGGSLQLMRMPIDGLLGLAGDSQRVTSVKLALDRADASVRSRGNRARRSSAARGC